MRPVHAFSVSFIFALSACLGTDIEDEGSYRDLLDSQIEDDSLRVELENDPEFAALVRFVEDRGAALAWEEAFVDDADAVQIPIIAPAMEGSSMPRVLRIVRTEEGDLELYTEGGEFETKESIDSFMSPVGTQQIPPSEPGTCDIGQLAAETVCRIATPVSDCWCETGEPQYRKDYYELDYYTNGRIRGPVAFTLYHCGPISSDPNCSSVCYSYGPEW